MTIQTRKEIKKGVGVKGMSDNSREFVREGVSTVINIMAIVQFMVFGCISVN